MKYTPEQTATLLTALAACRAESQGGGSASNACTKAIETLAKDITDDVTPVVVVAEGSILTEADYRELCDIGESVNNQRAYTQMRNLIGRLPILKNKTNG